MLNSQGFPDIAKAIAFLGKVEADPRAGDVCATLMTRLIVSMNARGPRRLMLDIVVTGLCVLVSALWVQANSLALLPAGLSGIAFGAIGIGIIGFAKSQMAIAFRAALQTFLRTAAVPAPRDAHDPRGKDETTAF